MVDDQRGLTHNLTIIDYILMDKPIPDVSFTQERKDAWIAKLESAGNNKIKGKLHDDEGNAACALGYLQDADNGRDLALPTELYNKIVELNDEQDLSLPEIAIWVKENVEVTDA